MSESAFWHGVGLAHHLAGIVQWSVHAPLLLSIFKPLKSFVIRPQLKSNPIERVRALSCILADSSSSGS